MHRGPLYPTTTRRYHKSRGLLAVGAFINKAQPCGAFVLLPAAEDSSAFNSVLIHGGNGQVRNAGVMSARGRALPSKCDQ